MHALSKRSLQKAVWVLALLSSVLGSRGVAAQAAGEVEYSRGAGVAQGPGQAPRIMGKGLSLAQGDRLTTSAGSTAIEEGMTRVRFVNDTQTLSDRAVNYLYSASDVGLNTCEGEGFGLNTMQHAAVGRPQVAPRTNAFVEYLDDDTATLVDPAHEHYTCGMTGDGPGGSLAQSCDPVAFADALETYVRDPEIRARHGAAARARILERFAWPDIGRKLARILRGVVGAKPESDAFDLVKMRPATVERPRLPAPRPASRDRTDTCRISASADASPVDVSWSAPCHTDSRPSTSAS